MNGSSNRASGAAEKPYRPAKQFSLSAARQTLPLVRRIVADLVHHRRHLDSWQPELNGLERDRRSLSWPERQRRYHLQQEAAAASRALDEHADELQRLGVVVLDAAAGEVGFPTVVNGRPALLSWQSDEPGVHFWRYVGETARRPIPPEEVLSGSGVRYANKG